MKKVTLFFLCALASFSSYGDTLAEFVTKDSVITPMGQEQANQAAPVANLTVGNIKGATKVDDDSGISFNLITNGMMPPPLNVHLTQQPILMGYVLFSNPAAKKQFSICSLTMEAGSGSMIKLESFSFTYSQTHQTITSSRAALPTNADFSVPMKFTLMARINDGEYISLQTLSVAGGTEGDKWVLEQKQKIDLSSAEIQAKIGSATKIEFDLRAEFGEEKDTARNSYLAFSNIGVDGTIVPYGPSVPEPSSALLCLAGLPFLLRRKRNR